MRLSLSFCLALLSAPFLALAGEPNPFNVPAGLSAKAGTPLTLTWSPTTAGTVTLKLRSGNPGDLDAGSDIVSGIPNSGSYTWTPPSSIVEGSDYTVEIIDDADPSKVNYTPQFTIISSNTVSSSASASASSSATTSSASSSSSSAASSSATSSQSSSSASSASTTSAMSSANSSAASASNAAVNTGSSSAFAPPRATAMAGVIGAMALGALAL